MGAFCFTIANRKDSGRRNESPVHSDTDFVQSPSHLLEYVIATLFKVEVHKTSPAILELILVRIFVRVANVMDRRVCSYVWTRIRLLWWHSRHMGLLGVVWIIRLLHHGGRKGCWIGTESNRCLHFTKDGSELSYQVRKIHHDDSI
jgi:hypothetical protein